MHSIRSALAIGISALVLSTSLALAGDSFAKIAKASGTTVESLRKLNPSTADLLRPGRVLKYQKASIERVITGWRVISTSTIAQRYNGGGDPNYAKKLEYALSLIRKAKEAACAQ